MGLAKQLQLLSPFETQELQGCDYFFRESPLFPVRLIISLVNSSIQLDTGGYARLARVVSACLAIVPLRIIIIKGETEWS